MDEQVWVLDNTPYDEHAKNYNEVGLAVKDKSNVGKEIENVYSLINFNQFDTSIDANSVSAPVIDEKGQV